MKQYMIKLLTILTNVLTDNLLKLGEDKVFDFVKRITCQTRKKRDLFFSNLEAYVPVCSSQSSVEEIAASVGCSLLKELAFKFLTYL